MVRGAWCVVRDPNTTALRHHDRHHRVAPDTPVLCPLLVDPYPGAPERDRVDAPLEMSEYLNKTIGAELPGWRKASIVTCRQGQYSRMANNLIVYAATRLVSQTLDMPFVCGFVAHAGGNKIMTLFPNTKSSPESVHRDRLKNRVPWHEDGFLTPCKNLENTACNYYCQSYNLFRGHQKLISSWFVLAPQYNKTEASADDFVIHYRVQVGKRLLYFFAYASTTCMDTAATSH